MAVFSSRGPRSATAPSSPTSSRPASTSSPPAPPAPRSATPSTSCVHHRSTAPRWPRRTSRGLAAILKQAHPAGTASSSRPRSPQRPCPSPMRPASTPAPAGSTRRGRCARPSLAVGVAHLGFYAVAAVRPRADADAADLHEHRQRTGHAGALAGRARTDAAAPAGVSLSASDAHGPGRRRRPRRACSSTRALRARGLLRRGDAASRRPGRCRPHRLRLRPRERALRPDGGGEAAQRDPGRPHVDRSGRPRHGFFDQRVVDGQRPPQRSPSACRPGPTAPARSASSLAADGAQEGVLTYDPEVRVHATRTITLDGDKAARFSHSVDQPVSSDGQFMGVFWNTSTGGTGFTFAGNADRLYAMPLQSSATGTVESYLNWMLSQPDAELIGPGAPMPLKSLGGGGALESRAFPVVDAGSVAALRTGSARRRSRSSPATAATSDRQPQRFRPPALSRSWPMRVPEPTAPGRSARRRCRSSKRGRSTCLACSSTTGRPGSSPTRARPTSTTLPELERLRAQRRCARGRPSEAGRDRRALRLTRAGGERWASGLGDAARLDARRLRRLWPRPAGGGAEHRHSLRQSGRGMGANGRGARRRWRHRRLPLRAEARLRGGHDDAGRVVRRADHLARRTPDRTVGLQLALPPGGLLPARDAAVRRPGGPPGRCPLPGRVRRTALPGRGAHRRGATIRSSLQAFVPPERHDYGSSTRSSATTPSGSD